MKKSNDGKGPPRKSSTSSTSSGRSRTRYHTSPRRSSSGQRSRSQSPSRPKTCGPLCPGAFCAGAPLARRQVLSSPANVGKGSQESQQGTSVSKPEQNIGAGVPRIGGSSHTVENFKTAGHESFGVQVTPETIASDTAPMHPGYLDLTAPDIIEERDLGYYIPAGIFHKDERYGARANDDSLISIDDIVMQEERRRTLEQQGALALTAPQIISEEEELIENIRKSIDAGRHRASAVGASPVHENLSPIRESPSPARGGASPVRGGASPVRGSPSPVRGSPSPIRGSPSPMRGGTSPVRGSASPSQGQGSPSPIARAEIIIQQAIEEQAMQEEAASKVGSGRHHACARTNYWAKLAAEGLLCPAVQGMICRGSPVTGYKSRHVCERRVTIDDNQYQNPKHVNKKEKEIPDFGGKARQTDQNDNEIHPNLTRAAESKDVNIQERISAGDAATGHRAMSSIAEDQEIERLTAPDMIEEQDLKYWIPAGIFHKKNAEPILGEKISPNQISPARLSPVFVPPNDTGVVRTLEDRVIRALSSPGVTTEEQLAKALASPGGVEEQEAARKTSSGKLPIDLIPQNATTLATALVSQNPAPIKRHSVAFLRPEVAANAKTTSTNPGTTASPEISVPKPEVGVPGGITPRTASETQLQGPDRSDSEQLPPGPERWRQKGPEAVISQPSEMWISGFDAPEPDTQHRYSHVAPLNQIYPRAYSSGLSRGLQISMPKIATQPMPEVSIKQLEKRQQMQPSDSNGLLKILGIGACILFVLCATGLTILKL